MSLTEYHRKRRFDQTAEPRGKPGKSVKPSSRKLTFVVQQHAASHLHYDFRLELDGVLKSWAVPKGPSYDPAHKRLAVQVEDHPLEYATFEGTIAAGQYGAGEVIVWDRGTWQPLNDPHEGLTSGKLELKLHGEKLRGEWHLVQMKGRGNQRKDAGKNWLLMKSRDEVAAEYAGEDIAATEPASVLSGRTIDDIGQGLPRKKRPAKKKAAKKRTAQKKSGKSKRPRTPTATPQARSKRGKKFPAAQAHTPLEPPSPQLATLAGEVPTGEPWLYEIKYDGYRLLATVNEQRVQLWTRNHLDWTHRFAAIAGELEKLPVQSAIFDGEVVALDAHGASSFQALQNSLQGIEARPLVYYVFDLLQLNGEKLTSRPLRERKDLLKQVLAGDNETRVRFSDHLTRQGATFLQHCCRAGLEGIIAKRSDRPYRAGRSADWVKVKCQQEEELVLGGFTISAAERRGFGALLLGYYVGRELVYAGRVGTGFNRQLLTRLRQQMNALQTDDCPFARIPPRESGDEVRWVKPQLVAQIRFTGWTDERVLRHPGFLGLREDKTARSVGLPESLRLRQDGNVPPKGASMPRSTQQTQKPAHTRQQPSAHRPTPEVDYPLTNPDRVLYPEIGLTKAELAAYYQQIADWLLPYLKNRPLSLVRCPEGQAKACFFQKHAGPGTPDVLRRIEIAEKDELDTYLIADDLPGLLSLAQMGVLEIHLWGSRGDRIEQPDWLIFDLDPAPEVAWKEVVAAGRLLRDLLADLKLTTFAKMTGGKGLHVVAPLAPRRADWPAVRHFTQTIAQQLARKYPDRFVATMSKAARRGRIFIDYLRNDRGATAIAPYSSRAKPGAPVAVPIGWDELTARTKPDRWNVRTLPRRLKQLASDPWAGFWDVKQSLPKLANGRNTRGKPR
jgi:bifunctional non-homologous end joining protein LigD